MIVTLSTGADPARVKSALVERGLWVEELAGGGRTQLLIEPHSAQVDPAEIERVEGVEWVALRASAHPRVDAQPRVMRIAGRVLGVDAPPVLVAGPCGVESEHAIMSLAAKLAPLGVTILRGGVFKPRTSPYSFQGVGAKALGWLARAARSQGLGIVTEVMALEHRDEVAEHADLLQIGSRNMQDFALLKGVAAAHKPMLLKRGMAATLEEWLSAAEYCLLNGAPAVIFCERGIRGFDPSTRNLLDLGAVAVLRHALGHMVWVDPSHAVGRRDLIAPLAKAAIAAGASGLMIEVHEAPGHALSDGPQALSPAQLGALAASLAITGGAS